MNPRPHLPQSAIARLVFAMLGGVVGVFTLAAHAQECPTLVWSDEFDGDVLDPSVWEHMLGDGCSEGICGWGNNELQYYQQSNAVVGDGMLRIEAREESVAGKDYTSSRIRTRGNGDWFFGRFEARMRLPEGQGIWPAFWMMPTDEVYGGWPVSGEIDIMESVGHEPDVVRGTIHYGDPWPNNVHSGEGFRLHTGKFGDRFHTFAVEKAPGVLRWFVDDVLYSTRTPSDIEPHPWPFDERFHFILNLAVGGNWPGPPDETTVFPQVLEVDYVRVYDGPMPYVEGDRVVPNEGTGTRYSVGGLPQGATVTWSVPAGAEISGGQGSTEINVDWGSTGGAVIAAISSACGSHEVSMDVLVESPYDWGFSFINFDDPAQVTYEWSSGSLSETNNPEPNAINSSARVGRYSRNPSQQYDVLSYSTESIPDAAPYLSGARRFFLDIYTTSPKGTHVILQLENSVRSQGSYPAGRHSRFEARTSMQYEWERLEFTLLDRPDSGTSNSSVDRLVLLFAPDTYTAHLFTFDNLDSYIANDQEHKTSTAQPPDVPTAIRLEQNYPNPFNPVTTIPYAVEAVMHVRMDVIDLLGRTVATLTDGVHTPGSYAARLDAHDLPSGTYLYRLSTNERETIRAMVLLR